MGTNRGDHQNDHAASRKIFLPAREAAMKADDNSGHQSRAAQGEVDSFSPRVSKPAVIPARRQKYSSHARGFCSRNELRRWGLPALRAGGGRRRPPLHKNRGRSRGSAECLGRPPRKSGTILRESNRTCRKTLRKRWL